MSIFINLNPDISSEVRSLVTNMFPQIAGFAITTNILNKNGNMTGVTLPSMIDFASKKEYFIWGGGGFWGGNRIVGP